MNQTKNCFVNGIALLKFICAFLVVWIHFGPRGASIPSINSITNYIDAFCRIAVPCFFMITGLFYDSSKSVARLKNLIKLTIVVSSLYVIAYIIDFGWEAFKGEMSKEFLLKWLVFNSFSPFAIHLWYLYSLIYSLIIIQWIHRLNALKCAYIFSIVVWVVGTFLNYTEYSFVCRSWIIIGTPSILAGIFLRNHLHQNTINKFIVSIGGGGKLLIISIMVCIGMTMAEVWLRNNNVLTAEGGRDMYLATLPSAVLVIQLFRNLTSEAKIFSKFVNIGKFYSGDIYLYHPIMYWFIEPIFYPASTELILLRPFIVFIVSLLFAVALSQCRRFIVGNWESIKYKVSARQNHV